MIARLFCLVIVVTLAAGGCAGLCKTNIPIAQEKGSQALANLQANYDTWVSILGKEKNPRVSAYIVLADQALGKLGPLMEVLKAGHCPPEKLVADALETAAKAQQAEPQP